MIKVVVIDDEPLAREIIKKYLSNYNNFELCAESSDGFEGIKAINNHKPDLIILDIKMPKISGFEMLEIIENLPSVIFTTAYDEFAVKAFDANAIDYLLKPFDKDRFDKAIEKFLNHKKSENTNSLKFVDFVSKLDTTNEDLKRVVVKTREGVKLINTDEIFYFEAYDDYVKIYTKDECFLKKKTMTFYEKNLENKGFVRLHRSFLVSLSQITKIENPYKEVHLAVLKNNKKIQLSRQGYQKLKSVFEL
ncbi:MAG: response regulator [Bacteroidetes bacterium]|nr:response regulator [Bacteroidota bacterium]